MTVKMSPSLRPSLYFAVVPLMAQDEHMAVRGNIMLVLSDWLYDPVRLVVRSCLTGCTILSDWLYDPVRLVVRSCLTGCTILSDWLCLCCRLDLQQRK